MTDEADNPRASRVRHLPYRATTATGNQFDFEFELHPETASAVHVANVLGEVLGAVDREIKLQGQIGNGDVLQSLCMAIAVRARMLGGNTDTIDNLARELLNTALGSSVADGPGNLSPDAGEPVH